MVQATSNMKAGFPYFFLAAAGAIDGISVVKKFGYNLNVTSNETVWDEGGLYVYPPSATIMSVASTDIDDTSGGSGARTITIVGLNENWLDTSEIVTLNGQTPVPTVNSYIRVFRAFVNTAGTSGGAEGNIYVGTGAFSSGVPANKYAKITNGNNQTLMAMYTVPDDKMCFVCDYYSNSGKSGEAEVDSFIRKEGSVFRTSRKVSLYESTFYFPNLLPFSLSPRTDIEIRAKSSVGTPISAGFDMLVVDKDKIFK